MIGLTALPVGISVLCLLSLACLPSKLANAMVRRLRRAVTVSLACQAVAALLLLGLLISLDGGPHVFRIVEADSSLGIGVSFYLDGASSLMLAMVSFVACVVSQYSIRYLDGEARQGGYFRWLGFTAGAVSLMVVAGNLLLFMGAWVLTSWGLHKLLLHYGHRQAAHQAAWTKFAISRLGDTFLLAALTFTFQAYGTFDLAELFNRATSMENASGQLHSAIGWLFILGAITKSAQFPFHTWLPNTMETPTPVSALMHAGIVNAGGYLVIRLNPLVSHAPEALGTLALLGTLTALYGSVVMMTQPSIKRALAYSTVAQMGFMMLQCGLGAYTAAMLHILAHSFYKAHAFLSSGSVLEQSDAARFVFARKTPEQRVQRFRAVTLAMASFLIAYCTLTTLLPAESEGIILAMLLSLAVSTWSWRVFQQPSQAAALVGLVGVFGLCLFYSLCYIGVHQLTSSAISDTQRLIGINQAVVPTLLLGFGLLLALCMWLTTSSRPAWLERLRIHATHGFYVEALSLRLSQLLSQRLSQSLLRQSFLRQRVEGA